MSDQEKGIVEEYCQKMDARHNKLMNVIYGLIVVILGAGAIQFVSFGEVKAQTVAIQGTVDFINKNYVPTIFLEGMQQNYAYQLEEIVATFTGDKEQIREISKKYADFQQAMIKQMISMKGGISSQTRSISNTATK
jgi:hypothetical protein